MNKFLGSLSSFFIRGWEQNLTPTKIRCNVLQSQVFDASEQLKRNDLTKKERKYYKKEKQRGIDGICEADESNKEFIVKALCSIGIAVIGFHKLSNMFFKKNN